MNRRHIASHYLFLPGYGYFKFHAVELENGYVRRFFPLHSELENVEWMPGVIALFPDGELGEWIAYLYYPFDFISMQSVAGTQRRQLL